MSLAMAVKRYPGLRRGPPQTSPVGEARLRAADLPMLVEVHADFVFRSLRRLGVPESMADDGVQQVFLVVQSKIGDVLVGRERAFLFSVAMNVASHARRTLARRREELGDDHDHVVDPQPLPDAALDQRRARALLDEVLEAMPMDLRTAFVMFELEEMTMLEIADVLAIPQGTVASRLRRAREEFQKQAQRVRARVDRPVVRIDGGYPSSQNLATAGGVR